MSHSSGIQSTKMEMSWQQTLEAAGHVESAVRKQRETKACAQLPFSFYTVQDSSLVNGATHSGCVFPPQVT